MAWRKLPMAKRLEDEKEPPTCTCDDCRSMCRVTCWPTPSEAMALLDAGHVHRLRFAMFDGVLEPITKYVWEQGPTPPGRYWSRRHDVICIFQDKTSGFCALHGTGMKPIEGRLASCKGGIENVREHLRKMWDGPEGQAVHDKWSKLIRVTPRMPEEPLPPNPALHASPAPKVIDDLEKSLISLREALDAMNLAQAHLRRTNQDERMCGE